jgi:hypothetical protein
MVGLSANLKEIVMNQRPDNKADSGVQTAADMPSAQSQDLQGEGNYDATRRYDKATRDFVQSGKVDEAARAARPQSPEEAEELKRAEREGQSHSKGEDPELARPSEPNKK